LCSASNDRKEINTIPRKRAGLQRSTLWTIVAGCIFLVCILLLAELTSLGSYGVTSTTISTVITCAQPCTTSSTISQNPSTVGTTVKTTVAAS
jgi:hypothetical protein